MSAFCGAACGREIIVGERRGGDCAGDRRVYGIARQSEGPEVVAGAAARGRSRRKTEAARRDGFGIRRCARRRDPRAHRRPRRRAPHFAEPVRRGRRPHPGRDSNTGDRPGLVLAFAALGFGVEWLFRKATQKTRQRLAELPMEQLTTGCVRRCAPRLCLRRGRSVRHRQPRPLLCVQLAAAPSPDAARLSRRLPHHRIAVVVGDFLAPDAERSRVVPTDAMAARFWCRRLTVFVGWFAFGWVTSPAQRSRLFVGGASAPRLRAWPWSSRHCAGSRLAPASAAGPGHRSPVTEASPRQAHRTASDDRDRHSRRPWVAIAMPIFRSASGYRRCTPRQPRDQAHGPGPP